jgi:hypothetical protein
MNKNKNVFYVTLIIIVFAIGVVRFLNVNLKYPGLEKRKVEKQTMSSFSKGIDFEVEGAEVFENDEVFKHLQSDYYKICKEEGSDKVNRKLFEVSVRFKNKLNRSVEVELYKLRIENSFYSNALCLDAMQFNGEKCYSTVQLEPNESKTIKMEYEILSVQFSDTYWKHLKLNDFYLVNDDKRYPVKELYKLA